MNKHTGAATNETAGSEPGRAHRIRKAVRHELAVWGAVAAYLFIAFSAILIYDWAHGGSDKAASEHFVFAAIRAVVLGKFVLAGKIFGVGELPAERPLVTRTLWRATALLAVTVIFVIIEEMVLALVKGETAIEGLGEFLARGVPDIAASSFLMFLIIVPLAAMLEVSRTVDQAVLRQVLFKGRTGDA